MLITKIVVSILICTGLLFAEEPQGIDGEIVAETKNTNGATYKFEIKPVSGKTTWCDAGGWHIVTNATTEYLEITGDVYYSNDYVFDH